MITDEHRKQTLSRAYVQAIVGKVGCNLSVPDPDYGIDLRISNVEETNRGRVDTGHTIAIQLKATHDYERRDGHIIYDLESRNYNILARVDVGTPAILVLLCLPKSDSEWLSITEDCLTLRRCAYWISLRGRTISANTRTVRVEIPCDQVFSPAGLQAMMERVIAGDLP